MRGQQGQGIRMMSTDCRAASRGWAVGARNEKPVGIQAVSFKEARIRRRSPDGDAQSVVCTRQFYGDAIRVFPAMSIIVFIGTME